MLEAEKMKQFTDAAREQREKECENYCLEILIPHLNERILKNAEDGLYNLYVNKDDLIDYPFSVCKPYFIDKFYNFIISKYEKEGYQCRKYSSDNYFFYFEISWAGAAEK